MDATRLKLHARQLLKIPLVITQFIMPTTKVGYFFLIYHSVSGHLNLELDISHAMFCRQLEWLAQTKSVISYDQTINHMRSNHHLTDKQFILTFDDGYENFYTHVFPLLQQFNLPAILFVPTSFIETGEHHPISQPNITNMPPVTWYMLREMIKSGLVTIGAHTHTHPNLLDVSETQLIEELTKPIKLFQQRLGIHVEHFAYPKGYWNQKIETHVKKYYKTAVIGGGKPATSDMFNPYRIPRIPIRRSDDWWFFRAKLKGWLTLEETMYDKLRHLKNRSHNHH